MGELQVAIKSLGSVLYLYEEKIDLGVAMTEP